MKVTVNIDCTPEEARAFFGLPDIRNFQDSMMSEVQKRMEQTIKQMDPETMLKTWLPASLEGPSGVRNRTRLPLTICISRAKLRQYYRLVTTPY